MKFYSKFYLYIKKVEWKFNWLCFLRDKFFNDYKFLTKNSQNLDLKSINFKEKLLNKVLFLINSFSNFFLNLSRNFFTNISNKNQTYNFLHIDYRSFMCIVLDEKFRKNSCYTNSFSNITFMNYLY
jgi:hypothetical protein